MAIINETAKTTGFIRGVYLKIHLPLQNKSGIKIHNKKSHFNKEAKKMGNIIYGNYIIEKYKEGYRVFLISIGKFVYCDSYREAVNEIHNDCKRFSN